MRTIVRVRSSCSLIFSILTIWWGDLGTAASMVLSWKSSLVWKIAWLYGIYIPVDKWHATVVQLWKVKRDMSCNNYIYQLHLVTIYHVWRIKCFCFFFFRCPTQRVRGVRTWNRAGEVLVQYRVDQGRLPTLGHRHRDNFRSRVRPGAFRCRVLLRSAGLPTSVPGQVPTQRHRKR